MAEEDNLEQKAERYYNFKSEDFIPVSGLFRYNRRSLNGYLDECKKAGKTIVPAFIHTVPRRTLLLAYNLAFVMGAAKILESLYDKL